jgi:type IV pilus assembly protein PilV
MKTLRAGAARRAAGFSMVEVLVAMVVSAVGLLGFAKLQAAALSGNQTARTQSLMALHAAGLAAAMNANRGFWATTAAPASVSTHDGVIDDPSGVLSAAADCHAAVCTPAQLAADDLQAWVRSAKQQFPSHRSTITCAAAAPQPPHCVIDVSWAEKMVAINRSTAAVPRADMASTQHYTLYVEP